MNGPEETLLKTLFTGRKYFSYLGPCLHTGLPLTFQPEITFSLIGLRKKLNNSPNLNPKRTTKNKNKAIKIMKTTPKPQNKQTKKALTA